MKVNFHKNPQDFNTLVMAALGFSNAFIKEKTKLSNSQIAYRLRKVRLSRRLYRDGQSPFARRLAVQSQAALTKNLTLNLRNELETRLKQTNLLSNGG